MTRKALSQIFSVLGCVALSATTHAAVNMNGGLSYTNNFDNLNDFESGVNRWQNSAVFSGGVANMTVQGGSFNSSHTTPNTGNIANSSSGKNAGTSNTPFTFPTSGLAPKVAASSFSTLNPRFGGNWIITQGVGDYNTATGTWANTGSAVLNLQNIGAHTSLNINMVLAIGDSFDNNTGIVGHDGPFQVLVDGIVVYEARFGGGGSLLSGSFTNAMASSTMTRTHSGLNANPSYLEKWNDNGGAGPLNDGDRVAEPWTLDSIWEFNLNLAHVSPDATIEFRHHVTSALTDEYLAIDSLRITAVPEPTVVALGGLGLGFMMLRRRRTAAA